MSIFGPVTDRFTALDGLPNPIAVAGTNIVRTRSKPITYGQVFSLSLKATVTAGTPDVDVYFEQSFQELTEAEETLAHPTFAVPEGVAKFADLTDELWHHFALSPLVLKFLRIRLEGQGANPASCTVDVRLGIQEER